MKFKPGQVETFLKSPEPGVRAALIFGPDAGLVRERADRLARSVVPDLGDPFRTAELTPAQLRDDPARLADEAAAIAFTGGRRVVRIRDSGDALTTLLQAFLGDPPGDALIVVEAGDLGARSSLRSLFEGAANGAAIACYADDGGGLEAVILDSLRRNGLRPDNDALAWLVDHLGGDRRLTRSELEKLALYVGEPGPVTLEHVLAAVGDAAGLSLDDLAFAAADGNQAAVQRVLDRLLREGTSPVSILRGVARHFQRLHLAAGLMAQGRTPDQAMAALKPRVIFKHTDRFRANLRRWPAERIAGAFDLLVAAELDCKTTGLPAPEICGRALIQIATAAGRTPSRR